MPTVQLIRSDNTLLYRLLSQKTHDFIFPCEVYIDQEFVDSLLPGEKISINIASGQHEIKVISGLKQHTAVKTIVPGNDTQYINIEHHFAYDILAKILFLVCTLLSFLPALYPENILPLFVPAVIYAVLYFTCLRFRILYVG